MVCPVCEHECSRHRDWCSECGAYLGLLKRQPRRISTSILATIAVGALLLFALAWHASSPLLMGEPVAGPGRLFWLELMAGAFFLALGLTARRHLVAALRSLRRPEPTPVPEVSRVAPAQVRRSETSR